MAYDVICMALTIQRLVGYEITDSNGNPTIETELTLSDGTVFRSQISSDNVINTYGMREMRDHDMQHYQGLGVKSAVNLINTYIGPKLQNFEVGNQKQIDDWLAKSDNTGDRSKLGINTVMAISQVFAKASAHAYKVPLYRYLNGIYQQIFKQQLPLEKIPTPAVGILAGGSKTEFSSYEVIPSSALPFSQAYELAVDIFHSTKSIFDQMDVDCSYSQFGEMIPDKHSNPDMIESILDTVQRKGLKLGKHLFMGLTINANTFFRGGKYSLKERPSTLGTDEYYGYLTELIGKYSVLLIEDAFATDDIDGWRKMYVNYGEQIYVVGHKYIGDKIAILDGLEHQKTITSIVVKPTYFGTITQALQMVHMLNQKQMSFIVSSDRGDTDDDFLADFGMAVQADFLKFGAPHQGERVAKYNRLLKIEQEARMAAANKPASQSGKPQKKE